MKHKFEFSPRMLLILFTTVCIILISVSVVWKDVFRPFSNVVATVVVPMQDGINSVGSWVNDHVGSMKSKRELEEENERLKEQVSQLQEKNQQLSQNESELSDLQTLVDLKNEYSDYPTTGAKIIGSGSSNWYRNFVINKGSKDGIKKNMNVIAGNGLVGIVTETGRNYAIVESIISDSSSVSAISVSSNDTCIVEGNSESMSRDGVLDVSYISKNAKMQAGDELITSNISSKYLGGLRIGTVSDIQTDTSDLTQSAKVTPVVDFQHLNNVLVITQMKEVPSGTDSVD